MNEIAAQNAYAVYAGLREALKQQGYLFLYIGKSLKDIRDNELYLALGYETFKDFLCDPELKQKPSTCYAYIRIYEFYIERLGLPDSEVVEVGMNRLQRLLPALKEKTADEAKQIISEIGSLTHSDYNREVMERGFDFTRPSIYKDDETGRYIIEFYPGSVKRIYNKETNETVLET